MSKMLKNLKPSPPDYNIVENTVLYDKNEENNSSGKLPNAKLQRKHVHSDNDPSELDI